MRVVVLCSSVYSETACAMAVRLAEAGHVPVGALALNTFNRATVVRKIGQLGLRQVAHYARARVIPQTPASSPNVHNPYLSPYLEHKGGTFRSLREVAAAYNFPLALCQDQNAPAALARLKAWSSDLIVFTGGNILRKPLIELPRLGVLNVHLGLLPEVRGMSTPEWSLLHRVPPGITIHYMDEGIDTGPILRKYEFPGATDCTSLTDLRNRLIAFGVDKIAEVAGALDRGALAASPQSAEEEHRQFFVMHSWLQTQAAMRLHGIRTSSPAEAAHG